MKMLQKFRMSRSWNHLQRCSTALFTNDTSLHAWDYRQWCASGLSLYLPQKETERRNVVLQVDKYENNIFGSCPRVYCVGCNVVPCGRSDMPGLDTVKLFCPNCNDVYVPPSSRFQGVDGTLHFLDHVALISSAPSIRQAPFLAPRLHTSSFRVIGNYLRHLSGRRRYLAVAPFLLEVLRLATALEVLHSQILTHMVGKSEPLATCMSPGSMDSRSANGLKAVHGCTG
jgi:hypothetical protein